MANIEYIADFSSRFQAAKETGDEEQMKPLMQEAFSFIDKDGSGFLDKEEVFGIFRSLVKMAMSAMGVDMASIPEEQQEAMKLKFRTAVNAIVDVLDTNADGKISFEEFCNGARNMKDHKEAF